MRLVPEKLTEPFTWSKQRMVFVNSMSDLFHQRVPDEYIEQVVQVMAAATYTICCLHRRTKTGVKIANDVLSGDEVLSADETV